MIRTYLNQGITGSRKQSQRHYINSLAQNLAAFTLVLTQILVTMPFSILQGDDEMKIDSRPSEYEFCGYFNLNEQDCGALDPEGQIKVLRTDINLPPFTVREREAFMRELARLFRENKRSISVPVWGEKNPRDPEFTMVDDSDDRTIGVEWSQPDNIGQPFVESIQSFLSARFPLWRVTLFGHSKETPITIYRDVIRFEPAISGRSVAEKLKNAMEIELTLRNATVGVEERQHAYIQKLLPTISESLNHLKEPKVICSFDCDRGDAGKKIVWLFHQQESPGACEPLDLEYGFNSRYEVSSTGALLELYQDAEVRIGYLAEIIVKSHTHFDTIVIGSGTDRWNLKVPPASDNKLQ
jgi:hypothetical protein